MRICATCFTLSCLPLLVMLLSETHVALLIKDKQCTEIHPNRPLSHQSICALLTKPTATFGADRHSPNVQVHTTPAVVFIVVILVAYFTASATLKTDCHSAHQLGNLLLSSALSSSSCRAGRREGGVGGVGGKLSRLGFETKCCGGLHHPARSFISSQNGHRDTHRRAEFSQRMNYKMRDITTTYIIKHSVMRTLTPQNVIYQITNPGTQPY